MKVKFTLATVTSVLALGIGSQAMATPANPGYDVTQEKAMVAGTPSIQVGESAAGHHGTGGLPAVGVGTLYNGMMVSIGGFVTDKYQDANGIAVVSAKTAKLPPSHSGMGAFNFAQVASDPVYFGEWSATGVVGDTTHTAFYAGKDVTINMPEAGVATYVVKGVSQYTGDNLLSGTLNADFGQKTLEGSLKNTDMLLTISANITGSYFEKPGGAVTGGLSGDVRGEFFGNAAASLAGIAQFNSDHTKDTAFGGTKQ